MKRALVILAMTGIYVWIRRTQQRVLAIAQDQHAKGAWESEGGANPSPSE
jgi:hypothetical protein